MHGCDDSFSLALSVLVQQVDDRVGRVGIETGRWLIQEEDGRVGDELVSDRGAFFLAS